MAAFWHFAPWGVLDIIQTSYCWHRGIKVLHQTFFFFFFLFFFFCSFFCFTLHTLIHLFSVFMPYLWADVFIFFSEGNAAFVFSGRIRSILCLWIFFLLFLFYLLIFFFSALPFYLLFPSSVPSLIHSFRLCNARSYYKWHLLPITVQRSKVLFWFIFLRHSFLPLLC